MVTLHKLSQLANLYFKLCVASDEDWAIQNIQYFLSFLMGSVDAHNLTPEEIKHWLSINRLPLSMFKIGPKIIHDGSRFLVFPDYKKSNLDYYFSLSPNLPSESEKEEITGNRRLNPYRNIPPIFFCNKFTISETSKLDPAIAHNFFVVRGLQKVSETTLESPSILQAASQFIKDNIDTINKIRRNFQYLPREMGEGADGVVFDISDFAVLKIFGSEDSFREAEKAMERMYRDPDLAKTEAMVYDAGTLGDFNYISQFGTPRKTTVYYSIVEKMTTMESMLEKDEESYNLIRDIVYEVDDTLFANLNKLDEMRQIFSQGEKQKLQQEMKLFVENMEPYIRSRMQAEINEMENKYLVTEPTKLQPKKTTQPIQVRPGWLSSLIEEVLFKKITGRSDLHMGNIGITGYGDFRFFDPIYKK